MKTQIIKDKSGKPTGVFIPIEDWENIKKTYPNIEKIEQDTPQWQKEILDERLADIDNPNKFKSIEQLFEMLDRDA